MPNDQPTRRFRLRFSLRQLFLAVALVGVGLAIWNWVFRKEVVVRAETPEDEVLDEYAIRSRRNAVIVNGRFTKSTWLLVSLNQVQAGVVQKVSENVVRRVDVKNENPLWKDMTFVLQLEERTMFGGPKTHHIAIAANEAKSTSGRPRIIQGAQGTRATHNLNIISKETVPGKITAGRPQIVYVEGDQAISVDTKMTLADFAKRNSGNYFIMTVQVR